MKKIKTSIVLNDQHIPFQDIEANKVVFRFIKYIKPDYIDILGDLLDFWQISKFVNDPKTRKGDIQDDINAGKAYLTELRAMAPKAEIMLHYGNHVMRLRKFMWFHAKELDCIDSLDLRYLLGLDKLKIKAVESEEGFIIRGNLVMTHGTVVSQDSAMTARRNLQKYGMSVICGHTHRLGAMYKTDLRGTVGAWENGCLCRLDLIKQWGRELANWQQGISLIDWHGDMFRVQQIPIIKNKMIFGKEVWE